MDKWWTLQPIIAPLPRGFMDDDRSHKEAREWMDRATDELEAQAKRIAELEAACNKVLDLCMDGAAERFNTLNMGQVFKILDAAIRGKAIS